MSKKPEPTDVEQEPEKTDRRGAPQGNLRAMLHGAYVKHLLSDGELETFRQVVNELYDTFDLNYSSDAMLTIMAAFNFIRWHRALESTDDELAMRYRREVKVLLESLKSTREKREPAAVEVQTPAQWAADLLARVRAADAAEAEKRENDGR